MCVIKESCVSLTEITRDHHLLLLNFWGLRLQVSEAVHNQMVYYGFYPVRGGGSVLSWKAWTHCWVLPRSSLEVPFRKDWDLSPALLTRRNVFLDLLVINTDELIRDTKTGGSLGCHDHSLVKFIVLRDIDQAKSKARTVNFRKANIQLLKDIIKGLPQRKVPWRTREQNRPGRSLGMLSIQCMPSRTHV